MLNNRLQAQFQDILNISNLSGKAATTELQNYMILFIQNYNKGIYVTKQFKQPLLKHTW